MPCADSFSTNDIQAILFDDPMELPNMRPRLLRSDTIDIAEEIFPQGISSGLSPTENAIIGHVATTSDVEISNEEMPDSASTQPHYLSL
jgi:hypothetical protein